MHDPQSRAKPAILFDPAQGEARLYQAPCAWFRALTQEEIAGFSEWTENELAAGRDVVLFLAYEAAEALAGLPIHHAPDVPLIEALSFAAPRALSPDEVAAWLDEPGSAAEPAPAGLAGWRAGITKKAYLAALAEIDRLLHAGETYQINYTFPLAATLYGSPRALYRRLHARQPTPFRLYAELGDRCILSFSPELFFTIESGQITARPMKGTAPRGRDAEEDRCNAETLQNDPKNRAENLMIVDLLRNDITRIAAPGSVSVPRLFSLEPYASVWQMTSTITATLSPEATWHDVWAALFPCGSVTGAPKYRSMHIIGTLEPHPRGLYTGAIGWISPTAKDETRRRPAGTRAVFSVAIRTLDVDASRRPARARLGVGSGVVLDSKAEAEYAECLLKGRFVTGLPPEFGLIETFSARLPDDASLIQRHFARMRRSARYFGFRFPYGEMREQLAFLHRTAGLGRVRARIVLQADGQFEMTLTPLEPSPSHSSGEVGVLFAEDLVEGASIDSCDPLRRHKTTHRALYDRAIRLAEAEGGFDALFFNERGELCEGGRSNVLVKLGGQWFTPPLRCGLLPGVTRARLIEMGEVTERVLFRDDVERAESLRLVNAVRGVMAGRLIVPAFVRDGFRSGRR